MSKADLASRASGGRVSLVGDGVHRASQVLVGDELLDEVQREVHKGCSPGLDRHAQYSQKTCQQPFLC